jgi:hypothetical protein
MKEQFFKFIFVFGLILFILPVSIFFKYFSTGTAFVVNIQSNERNVLIIFIILEIIVISAILRPISQQKISLAEKWKALKLEVENLVKELTTKKEEQVIDEDEEKLIKRLEEVSLNLDDAVTKYEKHKSYQQSGNKDRSSYYFQSSRYSLLGACKELRYLKYNEGLQKSGFNNVIMKLYEDVKSDIGLMYDIKR